MQLLKHSEWLLAHCQWLLCISIVAMVLFSCQGVAMRCSKWLQRSFYVAVKVFCVESPRKCTSNCLCGNYINIIVHD